MKMATKSRNSSRDGILLLLLRLCVLSLALLSITFYLSFTDSQFNYPLELIYTPIAILFGFSALSGFWLAVKKDSLPINIAQFFGDSMLTTLAIYMSGGVNTNFEFLYLLITMGSALFIGRTWAICFAAFNSTLYALTLFLLKFEILPSFVATNPLNMSNGELVLQVVGLSSAMILTAIVSTKLQDAIQSGQANISRSNQYIQELVQQKEMLLGQLKEVALDLNFDNTVQSANESAANFFQIPQEFLIGKSFNKLMSEKFINYDSNLEQINESVQVQLLTLDGTSHSFEISFQQSVHSPENEKSKTIIIKDITRLIELEKRLAAETELLSLKQLSPDYVNPLSKAVSANFIGSSEAMQSVFNLIMKVSEADTSVLISGESGTGKELVARAIHLHSSRASQPFIAINCGAFPDNLLESELFGHKKGSFTGAFNDHIGLFKQAEGGTIFLDEIGELPLHMQSKLLRVLQERVVRPIGSTNEIPINVRILSATNRNLKREVENGNFREDLFYRLNVIEIHVPSLRDRRTDIPLLIDNLVSRLSSSIKDIHITSEAMNFLVNYNYPGNVRELENIIEQAIVLATDEITKEHLPKYLSEKNSSFEQHKPIQSQGKTEIIIDDSLEFPLNLDLILQNIEKQYIMRALNQTNGIKKEAADLLGVNFRSFRYRLKKFELEE